MKEKTNTSVNDEKSAPEKKKKLSPKQQKKLAKKEAKKLKKEKKKEEKIPKNKPLVLNPFLVTTRGKYFAGLAARAFTIAFAAFALVYFFLDTINVLTYTNTWFIFFTCIFFTFPIVFSTQNKWAIPIACGIGVLWIVYLIFVSRINLTTLMLIGTNIADLTLARMVENGFGSLIGINTGFGLIISMEVTVKCIAVFLSLLFSVIFAFSLGKRAHIVPFIISHALIVAPALVCNIVNKNWGTALVFLSYCVIAVLYISDKLFLEMTNPKSFDTETVLNPAFVLGVDTPLTEDKKDKKARKKEEKKNKKKEKVLLDDELDDLLSASPKKKEKKVKVKVKLTKEEKEERRKTKRTLHLKKYAKCAVSGFTALSILVAGYAAIALPSLVIDQNFRKIKFMEETMSELRDFITALLIGDDLTLDLMSYENDPQNFSPRPTDLTPRHYYDIPMFDIELQRSMPVYLRGWVSNSYKDGSWYLDVEDPSFEEFRNNFGARTDAHENLLDSFLKYMNPSVYDEKTHYLTTTTSQLDVGYVTTPINIARYFSSTTSLYTPAFINSKYGIRAYRSILQNEKIKFANFFDGIFASRYSEAGAQYGIVANLPTMENKNYEVNISRLISEFYAQVEYLKMAEGLVDDGIPDWQQEEEERNRYYFKADGVSSSNPSASSDMIVDTKGTSGITPLGYKYNVYHDADSTEESSDASSGTLRIVVEEDASLTYTYIYDARTRKLQSSYVTKNGIPDIPAEGTEEESQSKVPDLELALRFYQIFNNDERKAFFKYVEKLDSYDEYVSKYYTASSESEIIKKYAEQFKDLIPKEDSSISTNKYLETYKLVNAIIDNLEENYTYTLEPSSMGDPSLSGVENFIQNVKEGYCVQFASTLTLTLRELGIPARYVEGYLARSFMRNPEYKYVGDPESKTTVPNGLLYMTRIKDSDEHAWVEVWIDGIGWVQFEATPGIINNVPAVETTKPEETTKSPEDTNDPLGTETLPEETTSPDESETLLPGDTSDSGDGEGGFKIPKFVIYIIISVLAAALILLLLILINKRAKKADAAKEKFIEDGIGKESREERRSFSTELSKRIFELLKLYGLSPEKFELPADYRIRLTRETIALTAPPEEKTESTEDYDASGETDDENDESPKPTDEEIMATAEYTEISEALDALEAEEFGSGMSRDEFSSASLYYKTLLSLSRRKLGFVRIIIYRYILNKI